MKNERGRVTTVDTNEAAGSLLGDSYVDVVDFRIGDSVALLPEAGSSGFVHPRLAPTAEHEAAELEAVSLTADAVALSDNAHVTDVLAGWAERTGRRFYFQERPRRHWYPGNGASWPG